MVVVVVVVVVFFRFLSLFHSSSRLLSFLSSFRFRLVARRFFLRFIVCSSDWGCDVVHRYVWKDWSSSQEDASSNWSTPPVVGILSPAGGPDRGRRRRRAEWNAVE